jgi:hypothetical protein
MTFGPLLARAAPDRLQALDAALAQGFAAHLDGDQYRLAMHVRIGLGTRPAGPA